MTKRQAAMVIVLGWVVISVALYNIIVTFVHIDKQMRSILIFFAVNVGVWIYTEKIIKDVFISAFGKEQKE